MRNNQARDVRWGWDWQIRIHRDALNVAAGGWLRVANRAHRETGEPRHDTAATLPASVKRHRGIIRRHGWADDPQQETESPQRAADSSQRAAGERHRCTGELNVGDLDASPSQDGLGTPLVGCSGAGAKHFAAAGRKVWCYNTTTVSRRHFAILKGVREVGGIARSGFRVLGALAGIETNLKPIITAFHQTKP